MVQHKNENYVEKKNTHTQACVTAEVLKELRK